MGPSFTVGRDRSWVQKCVSKLTLIPHFYHHALAEPFFLRGFEFGNSPGSLILVGPFAPPSAPLAKLWRSGAKHPQFLGGFLWVCGLELSLIHI